MNGAARLERRPENNFDAGKGNGPTALRRHSGRIKLLAQGRVGNATAVVGGSNERRRYGITDNYG